MDAKGYNVDDAGYSVARPYGIGGESKHRVMLRAIVWVLSAILWMWRAIVWMLRAVVRILRALVWMLRDMV